MKDVVAERILLSSIAQYGNEVLVNIEDIINEDCFHDENKYIYQILNKGLSKLDKISTAEFLTISKDLGYDSLLKNKQYLDFIKSLFVTPVIKDNIHHHAVKLRKISIIKQLLNGVMESYEKLKNLTGNEDLDQIFSILEIPHESISASLGVNESKPELLFKDAEEIYRYLEDNQTDTPGIPTGYGLYDQYILGGGLRRGYVNMIVARPKAGKSTFLLKVAENIASIYKIPVLYLDTELDKECNLHRIICGNTTISYQDIETGKFANSPKKNLVYKQIEEYSKIPLYYKSIPGKPFDEILRIIKNWIKTEVGHTNGVTNNAVVIYDYFKLMSDKDLENMTEHASIGYQMQKLCDFTKVNQVACLSAVQSNRDGLSKESTDIVAGSDRIVWFTSSLCLLRKKTFDEINEEGHNNGNIKLIPLDALRFSKGFPGNNWINYSFDNFNAKEINIGPT